MKWIRIIGIIGIFVAIVAMATLLYYGGSDEKDHEIVGYVSGIVSDVNFETWQISVDGTPVFLRGRYDCNGVLFYTEDMLQRIDGEKVRIGYSEDLGYPVAEEIEVNGAVCIRIPGRGAH